MLENFTLETFAPLVGSVFALHADPTTTLELELELVEAAPLGSARAPSTEPARQPFSLVFRGALTPVAPQRVYQLDNAALGAFELFLVPIGPDEQGMQYQAIFT